jgi:hypothetical protein
MAHIRLSDRLGGHQLLAAGRAGPRQPRSKSSCICCMLSLDYIAFLTLEKQHLRNPEGKNKHFGVVKQEGQAMKYKVHMYILRVPQCLSPRPD